MTEIELVVAKIREDFGTGDAKRDAGLTTPSDTQRYDNICYGKDPVWQRMRSERVLVSVSAKVL